MKDNDCYSLLENTSTKDMIFYLENISNDDIFFNKLPKYIEKIFVEMLLHYKVIFVASDNRLILTEVGNILFRD